MHTVERQLDAALLTEVTRQRDAQRRWIAALGAMVVAGLVVMVAIGWWVARSRAGVVGHVPRFGVDRPARGLCVLFSFPGSWWV